MTGCEWQGRLRVRNDLLQETPMWTFTVDVPHHNHDRVVGGNALFHHRGRRPDTPARIANMWRQHAPASSITTSLLLDGENISISDVRNEIARLRREELSGRTMIEAFVHHLEHFSSDESGDPETKYWCKIEYSSDGHVQNVFFAHPDSFKIIKANPDVIQIDATYKINRFGMPLLHTVGVTSREKTYDLCFGFMQGETAFHYQWHMDKLKEFLDCLNVTPRCFVTDFEPALKGPISVAFPGVAQRLCIWHINQNVLKQAVTTWRLLDPPNGSTAEDMDGKQKGFMKMWNMLVAAPTEEQFLALWDAMEVSYHDYPALLDYLRRHQLPHKDEWAEYRCSHVPDYGIRVTSRVESAHHRVKLTIVYRGQSHLLHVVKDIHRMMLQLRNNHDSAVALDAARIATDVNDAEFDLLKRKVSHQALRRIKKQLNLAKSDDWNDAEACTRSFTAKFGLPCKHWLHHQLERHAAANDTAVPFRIPLSMVDQHWWFYPPRATGEIFEDVVVQRILDPLPLRSRGRPIGATTLTIPRDGARRQLPAETRELSGFEHALASQTPTSIPTPTPTAPAARGRSRGRARGRGAIQRHRVITETVEFVEDDRIMDILRQMQAQITALQSSGGISAVVPVDLDRVNLTEDDVYDDTVFEDIDEIMEEYRSSDGDFSSPGFVEMPPPRASSRSTKGRGRGGGAKGWR